MTNSESDQSQSATQDAPKASILGVVLRVSIPLGILALGCLAYSLLAIETEEEKAPALEAKVLRTRVTEIQVGDYPVVVRTHGVIQPHNQVTVSAQVSGQVKRVSPRFEVGAYFYAGDVLVELDDRDYLTAVAVAKANHRGAQSALELATQTHERLKELFAKNGISEAEVNEAAATQAQAAANLDSSAAQLEQAERDLERTKIVAAFDGRVRQKEVGLGQLVGAGTALGVVFAVDYAEIRLPIAGRELPFLKLPEMEGDPPVEVELRNAIGNSSANVWKAHIVRTEGALDKDSLELFAIARVDDPFGLRSGSPPLRIGQPLEGSIGGKILTDVVALPRLAVRRLDQVYLVDQEKSTLSLRTIVPIWSDKNHVFVQDPMIKDGSLLSTTHLVHAADGAPVEIISEIQLTASADSAADESKPETVAN